MDTSPIIYKRRGKTKICVDSVAAKISLKFIILKFPNLITSSIFPDRSNNPRVAKNDSWKEASYNRSIGLKISIKNPAKNSNFIASEFLPKTLAKITSNAIMDALTMVADAPVMMAKNIIAIEPTSAETFLPKTAKIIIINWAKIVKLNPERTIM